MSKTELFFKKELIDELRLVEKKMRAEESLEKKIYLFSAAYGIANRTYRYSFSRDVLLIDLVLHNAYGLLFERIQRIKKEGDNIVPLENVHFEKLQDGLKMLADSLENDKSIQEALELIVCVSFSTTGPGNYLREKGMLTF